MSGALGAPLLALAPLAPAAAAGPDTEWIDTSNRAEVLAAYTAEFERIEPESGYDGNPDTCTPGTTSQEFRESVVQRVNWYRRMAGLDVVTERAAYSADNQLASTMMAAEGRLDHLPDSGWDCHTAAGAAAAGRSNLALGVNGVRAVDAYIRDPGGNNLAVGHRRTLLHPPMLEIGTGDVDAADGNPATNSIHVFGDNLWGDRPEVRESRDFVAWPPSGYVPPGTVWSRWSFSLGGADFSAATVSVRDALGEVQVEVLDRIQAQSAGSRIAPEPAIVWAVGSDADSAAHPTPDNGDECYSVDVSGVTISGAVQPDYEYTTCVIDPSVTSSAVTPPFGPSTPTGTGTECDGAAFAVWTVPCWHDRGSLGGFTDVDADWQRGPVAWLVGNGITTGVSPTRFDPGADLTRAQAATLIWRLVGSPAPPADAPTFSDVAAGSYYADAVHWMARFGVTTGTGGGRFSPDAPATRAEFVTLLWRLIDEPQVNGELPFTDLTAGWQVTAVRWAASSAVTTGTSPTTFAPNDTVTRGQAAALLARFGAAISAG